MAGRPRNTRIDNAIIEAGRELFSEVGYSGMTFAEIARRANATTPAIYRRYQNKIELMQDILCKDLESLPHEAPDTGRLRSDMLALAQSVIQSLPPERVRLLAGIIMIRDELPTLSSLVSRMLKDIGKTNWQPVLDRARLRGEISIDNIPDHYTELLGSYITTQVLIHGQVPDISEIEAIIDDMLIPILNRFSQAVGEKQRR